MCRIPIRRSLVLFLLLVAASGAAVCAAPPRLRRTDRYAPDRLIVKFKDGITKGQQQVGQNGVRTSQIHRFRKSGAVVLKLEDGQNVDDVIEKFRGNPDVEYARRDHYLSIDQNFPNDSEFESCWGLHNTNQYLLGKEDADIDAPEAWDITTGSSNVIVAVIDTGVEYTHQDLAGNMWVNTAEQNGTYGVDDDGNGYVDDIHGISVIGGTVTGDPMDDHGHGTHCAGILGAVGNNGEGICGVNWDVSIMALKFLDASGWGLESDAAVCLEYAVDNGATITSNSYGGPDDVQALYDAIAYANDNGVLFCTSAGNSSEDVDVLPSYPAVYDLPNIITVAATDYGDYLAWFSNYGAQSVDVAGPGEVISSTWLGGEYKDLDGTSMACPFVAGIAALVKANEPGINLSDLWGRVVWTGDSVFDLQETTVTGLRVNAYNALEGIYSVRILSQSPLPDGTENEPYSFAFDVQGFAPPFHWEWGAPEYVEKEVENRFTYEGTARNWQLDEGMWHLALPFDFPFYGSTYDDVYVCSNGYLEFSDTTPFADGNTDRDRLRNKKMIAPYWSDLNTDSAYYATDIYVWQPDDKSIGVRWKATELEWLFPMLPVNFSVVLHSDGRIEMNYGGSEGSLIGPVVGISNGDGVNYRLSYAKTGKSMLAWAPTSLFTGGEIPPGLSLDPDTGVVSGTPTAAGDYVFDVTAGDTSGGESTRQFAMKVHPENGPWPAFSGTPLRGVETLEVNFADESTFDSPIASWLWNFGDGTTSSLQNPAHTYSEVGHYAVSLTVWDETGSSNTHIETEYVHVFASGPAADFSASPTTGLAPLSVTFTDASVPVSDDILDSLYTWRWDFGDGVVETRYVPDSFQHVYQDAGIYTVTLEVQDLWERAAILTRENYVFVGVATDYDLTWNTTGDGSGTVTVTPPGVTSAGGTETYAFGSVVDLTANPSAGSHFVQWTGDVDDALDLSTSTYIDGNKTVTAVFGSGDPGVIEGAKWHDTDGDGVWDAEESGIGGWRIFLDEDSDGEWDEGERYALTGNDGAYAFANLPPGAYTVAEESSAGWQQTAPSSPGTYAVALDAGETESGMNFGNRFVGSPPPEPINPLPSDAATGEGLDTVLSWELDDSASSADYEEDFDDGSAVGWVETTDGQWEVVSGEYRAYSDVLTSQMTATYSGVTWSDLTYEATIRRSGDSYPSSALVFRATDDFALFQTGSGYFVAINSLGQFCVGEQLNGVPNLFPTAGWTSTANLNTGNAANLVTVTIEGASIDVSFNGVWTWSGSDSSVSGPGRIGVYGRAGDSTTTTHYFDDVRVIASAATAAPVSNAQGAVSTGASSVTFDVYFGTEETPTTLVASDLTQMGCDPTPAGDLLPATTYYWQVVAKNPAGETPGSIWSFSTESGTDSGVIRGLKWSDLNGDGEKNANEPGLQGWTIFIDANRDGAYEAGEPAAVTDGTGAYEFSGLAAGDYLLGEIEQEGWRQTYPSGGVGGDAIEPPRSAPGPGEVTRRIIDSPPHPPVGANVASTTVSALAETAVTLGEVPTSRWTYGCSATSAGMMFGYYDRTGYSGMYTGPANGGVCPLTNLGQGISTPIAGACSIIATQNGFDGRTTAGHVNDYWISTDSAGPDPWEASGVEHVWGDCTADFMGTNQWKWNYVPTPPAIDANRDGATTVWHYNSATKLYDYVPSASYGLPQTSLCHGMRLFAESRGYTVVQNYTQMIDTEYTGGFSYDDYKSEIDAGRPVMIQVEGHTMVGVGYDTASETMYIHDTWDNNLHSMTWGGSYYGMAHYAVTVIELAAVEYPGMHTVTLSTGGLVEDVNFGNQRITYPLTIAAAPATGGGTLPLPGTYVYDYNEVVAVEAFPASGYQFDHWVGDVADPSSAATTVNMDAAKSVTAVFVRQWTLTVAATPSGGGTTAPAAGDHVYDDGTVVNLSATANTGYTFDHWEGDVADPNAAETTVTMDGDKTVTAVFVKQWTLTVAATPSGGGTTAPAAGDHVYDDGTVVNLTATANSGYTFDHWEGDVADPNAAETTVTMDGEKTVTAVFEPEIVVTHRFDFGTSSSPVETGCTRVTEAAAYSAAVGHGWLLGGVDSRDREIGAALTRDFCFSGDATFGVDLAPASYDVTVTLGDATHEHDRMGVFLEGAQVDEVTTATNVFATNTYSVDVTDGQLTLRLRDMGGSDANVTINALEIVSTGPPAATLTVEIAADAVAENAGAPATTGRVTRSGDTANPLVVTLASDDTTEASVPASATILAGQAYADFDINAVDDAVFDGDQTVTITATAAGYLDGTDTVMVTDDEVPSEPEGRYDFGTATSPVETDYIRVTHGEAYSAAQGYGWLLGSVDSRDRTAGTALTRDFCFSGDATFVADVANGSYDVTVTLGDATHPHDQMGIFLEGVQVDSVTTDAGVFSSNTYSTDVADGQLTLRLRDMGGADANVTINAVAIVSTGPPPAALAVEIAADTIAENAGVAATTGRVTRSGDTTNPLVVTLSSDDASEATVAASVTILAGESYADFDIDAVDDAEADGDQTVTITATAASYAGGSDTVIVTDNEVPVEPEGQYDFGTTGSPVASGYTRVSQSTVYSGAQGYGWLLGTVDSRDRSSGTALTRDFCFTGDATFVADVASGDYEVTVTLGDATHAHDQMGIFLEGVQVDTVTTSANSFSTTAYAVHVGDGQLTLRVADLGGSDANVTINAVAIVSTGPAPDALTVTINPDSISEAAGPSAATGRVTRNGDTTGALDVSLTSDDTTEATVPATVTILAGESTADFTVNAVDDSELDGAQTVTITATATTYLDGSDTLTVTDDEVPPEPVGRYDFGTAASPVEPDYTRVSHTTGYSVALGHGWTAGAVDSRDRATGTALTRDFCFTTDATFEVDLATGDYDVAVTLGDLKYGHDRMGVTLEGTLVDDVTTAKGETATGVYTVSVTDGALTVRLHDLGGDDVNVTVIAIEIMDVSAPANAEPSVEAGTNQSVTCAFPDSPCL